MDTVAQSTDRVGTASGKVILLGEHAVVHGVPALAAAIGRGARAVATSSSAGASELRVRDATTAWEVGNDSELARAFAALLSRAQLEQDVLVDARIDIPTRAGLGSSACLGVAVARAVLSLQSTGASPAEVEAVATAWEQVFHGNPSGIDVAVAVHGGCIEFLRGEGVSPLSLTRPIPLCVGDTTLRSSTRAMVEQVAIRLAAMPGAGREVLDGIGACVRHARGALVRADWAQLGQAMNQNQEWLARLALATTESDLLCQTALRAGALGAKVTGAGGGGCVIALAPSRQDDVLEAWRRSGLDGFSVDAGV